MINKSVQLPLGRWPCFQNFKANREAGETPKKWNKMNHFFISFILQAKWWYCYYLFQYGSKNKIFLLSTELLETKITRKNKKQNLPMTNFKVNHTAIDKLIRILVYTMKCNYHFLIFILIKSIYLALPNLSFLALSYMNCIPLLWKRWQGGDKFCLPCPISSRLILPHLECVFIYLLFNIYIYI